LPGGAPFLPSSRQAYYEAEEEEELGEVSEEGVLSPPKLELPAKAVIRTLIRTQL
jgi:hypothetical protein